MTFFVSLRAFALKIGLTPFFCQSRLSHLLSCLRINKLILFSSPDFLDPPPPFPLLPNPHLPILCLCSKMNNHQSNDVMTAQTWRLFSNSHLPSDVTRLAWPSPPLGPTRPSFGGRKGNKKIKSSFRMEMSVFSVCLPFLLIKLFPVGLRQIIKSIF